MVKAFAKRRRTRKSERTALDLIEEAFHLLRTAPLGILTSYLIGSLPFVLGLLFFWADMASNAFAHRHVLEASFGIAALFLWMKAWHAVFASQLLARLSRQAPPRWTPGAILRLAVVQTIVQPTGLIAIPAAATMLIPLGWVYAFYQNFSLVGNGGSADLKAVIQRTVRQTSLWPGQNHLLLLIVSFFSLFVFFNIGACVALVPELLKMLLGIETVFSQTSMLNSTFFAVVFGITWLCVDPLVKAIYTLRCFYGESRHSGADLRAELQNVAARTTTAAAAWIVLGLVSLFCFSAQGQIAAPKSPEEPPANIHSPPSDNTIVDSAELNDSINKTIQKQEYSWRLPREKVHDKEEKSILEVFIDDMLETFRGWMKTLGGWIEKFSDWIKSLFPERKRRIEEPPPGIDNPWDWQFASQVLISALLCVAVSIAAVFLLRVWKTRRLRRGRVESTPVYPIPDLTDESITASDLPADRWRELANELLAKGEFRLALRALYMACLAQLAGRELVTIARFKSNREYQRELTRKARAQPDMLNAFSENTMLFERSWYGRHEATRQTIEQFDANQNRITSSP